MAKSNLAPELRDKYLRRAEFWAHSGEEREACRQYFDNYLFCDRSENWTDPDNDFPDSPPTKEYHCTACGERFSASKDERPEYFRLKHNDETRCPYCDRSVAVKQMGRIREGLNLSQSTAVTFINVTETGAVCLDSCIVFYDYNRERDPGYAGETVSKQVYVAKDQVQSVTLAYFSATIKVTYPAKSTCVIKNSSGTQVANDTNTGTAAKTWTATVGASGTYTITATATDGSGKTKSTTVSITTDGQNVSATLAYDYIIFSNATGLNSVYSDGGGGAPVEIGTDSSGKKTLTFTADDYSRMSYLKPAIDLTNYATLKISGYADGSDSYLAFWSKIPQEYDPSIVAKVVLSNGSSPSSYTIDVSKLSGSYYLGAQYAGSNIVTYDLRLE